jgi:hypothetical protein
LSIVPLLLLEVGKLLAEMLHLVRFKSVALTAADSVSLPAAIVMFYRVAPTIAANAPLIYATVFCRNALLASSAKQSETVFEPYFP